MRGAGAEHEKLLALHYAHNPDTVYAHNPDTVNPICGQHLIQNGTTLGHRLEMKLCCFSYLLCTLFRLNWGKLYSAGDNWVKLIMKHARPPPPPLKDRLTVKILIYNFIPKISLILVDSQIRLINSGASCSSINTGA